MTPDPYKREMIHENNTQLREMRALDNDIRIKRETAAIVRYLENIANAKTADSAEYAFDAHVTDDRGEMIDFETYWEHVQRAIETNGQKFPDERYAPLYRAYTAMKQTADRLGIPISG